MNDYDRMIRDLYAQGKLPEWAAKLQKEAQGLDKDAFATLAYTIGINILSEGKKHRKSKPDNALY